MEKDTLLSLFKSKELEEQSIVAELLKVNTVVEQRQAVVAELKSERQGLQGQLKDARKLLIRSNSGDPDLIQRMESWKGQIEGFSKKLESAEVELLRAKERSDLIQSQLAATRLEKARIEKLIDEANLAKLIKRSAVDEVQNEESTAGQRSKSEWS